MIEKKIYHYNAVCINIIDGDTIDCNVDLGFNIKYTARFRLLGINTPEIYGPKVKIENKEISLMVKKYLESLILNTPIIIQTIKDKQDKYGRYLINIYLKDEKNTNVNDLLKEYCKINFNIDITYLP